MAACRRARWDGAGAPDHRHCAGGSDLPVDGERVPLGSGQGLGERFSRLGKLVRYADDLVILTWQRWQAELAWKLLSSILARPKLELAANKTRLVGLDDTARGSTSSGTTTAGFRPD